MNDGETGSDLQRKLEALRTDFAAVAGAPFHNFYCPILFADDLTEICRAHLVNQAFSETSRRWTVQRKDVDNFYGTSFEADFVELKESYSPIETLIANGLSGRHRPEISYRREKLNSTSRRLQFHRDTRRSCWIRLRVASDSRLK